MQAKLVIIYKLVIKLIKKYANCREALHAIVSFDWDKNRGIKDETLCSASFAVIKRLPSIE